MNSSVRYWILLAGVLAAGYASFVVWRWRQPEPSTMPPVTTTGSAAPTAQAMPPVSVDHFELTDQNGEPFDSKSLRGKVWVASFFFVNCPGVCWRMNQALTTYQQTHPDSTAHFVSITCDPDNDTPEALTKYAEHFKADPKRWTFLTGDLKEIQRIGKEGFQISVVEKEHTDRACVVDRNGQVRGRFRLTEPDQVMMLEKLLSVVEAEQAEPGKAAAAEADPTAPPSDEAAPEVDSQASRSASS